MDFINPARELLRLWNYGQVEQMAYAGDEVAQDAIEACAWGFHFGAYQEAEHRGIKRNQLIGE